MDRQIDPVIRRNRILRRVAIFVVVAGFAWAAFAASLSLLRPSVRQRSLRTARVERGPIQVGFDASGTVVPASERSLSSPIDARLLRVVKRAGSVVHAGDPLLELDTSESHLALQRLGDRISQNQSQRQQLESQRDQNLDALNSRIEQSELDLEILRYRDQQNQKLRGEGLISEETAKQSAVALRKGEIELLQLRKSIEATSRSANAQIAAVNADLNTLRNEQKQAERELNLARTMADRDGVLTWIVEQEGTTIRKGEVVARVADLSTYRVEATVSDVHAVSLRPGLEVRVSLDGAPITGRIATVDPTISSGVARFFVDLDSGADPRLRNSMRVDLFVITGSRENVLKVRKGSSTDGAMFRIAGDVAVKSPVRLGMSSSEEVEILGGLSAGDEVILSDMSDYTHAREVRLK